MRPTKTKTKRERERESKREKKEERIRRRKSELWRQRSLTSRIAINGKCSSVHWNVYIHDWFYIYATKLSCSCGTFFAHSAIRWPLLFVFCLSLTGRFHGLTRASYKPTCLCVSALGLLSILALGLYSFFVHWDVGDDNGGDDDCDDEEDSVSQDGKELDGCQHWWWWWC